MNIFVSELLQFELRCSHIYILNYFITWFYMCARNQFLCSVIVTCITRIYEVLHKLIIYVCKKVFLCFLCSHLSQESQEYMNCLINWLYKCAKKQFLWCVVLTFITRIFELLHKLIVYVCKEEIFCIVWYSHISHSYQMRGDIDYGSFLSLISNLSY